MRNYTHHKVDLLGPDVFPRPPPPLRTSPVAQDTHENAENKLLSRELYGTPETNATNRLRLVYSVKSATRVRWLPRLWIFIQVKRRVLLG